MIESRIIDGYDFVESRCSVSGTLQCSRIINVSSALVDQLLYQVNPYRLIQNKGRGTIRLLQLKDRKLVIPLRIIYHILYYLNRSICHL